VVHVPVRIRYGWLIAIAGVYLYLFPYFPRVNSANELPRVYLVKAIVEDHTFAIDRQVKRYSWVSDLSQWDGHYYQNKAPGSSLLVVPVYAAVRLVAGEPSLAVTMWMCRIVAGVIPALIFLLVMFRFLERTTPEPEIRRLVLVTYALGSMAMTYALLYYSHQLSAVCLAGAWILITENRRPVVAGLLAGCAILVDYQTGFAVLPLGVYMIVKHWRHWRPVLWAIAGGIPPLAVLLGYHLVCFGSPLRTGYATAVVYGADHAHGLLGMTFPKGAAIWGTMLAADNGLFVLMPWLLLAVPGGFALWKRDRAFVATCLGVVGVFLYFVWSIGFWRGGWEVGPRYVTAMLPFLLPLVAAGVAELRRYPRALELACGAMLASVAIYTLSAATLPYWADQLRDPLYPRQVVMVALRDPLVEITLRLLGDGAVAPSLGSACGIPGLLGIAPALVTAAAVMGWAIVRVAGRTALVFATVVAIVVLGAFTLVPHGGPAVDRVYAHSLYPAVAR
jgi:hypothetical protein